MNKTFANHIGTLIEVYIDDMLVMMTEDDKLVSNLEIVFGCLHKHKMRLNPKKYTFAVETGKFLGFMLTHWGIKTNPDKRRAILEMKSLTFVKEVQHLMRRIASLSKFLVVSAWKTPPFFATLKKESTFEWTSKCKGAFTEFKKYLSSPPILYMHEIGHPLYLYLSVSNATIASALVREDSRQQHPIYIVSKALQGSKLRYQKLEKSTFALLVTARHLRQYFHAHLIMVRTNQPIQQVLQKQDFARRMMAWLMELSEFEIQYEPQTAIKA